jgi:phosphoribosylformylglycinamidine synthase
MVTVIRFPGTNCDEDTKYAFEKIGAKATILWHNETLLPKDTSLVVLAGGFSYGDYLRSGAIAKTSKIMTDIISFAKKGGRILGICNGFQILAEAHLLTGVLMRNENLHFISSLSHIKVVNNDNIFLQSHTIDEVLSIPVAHADGNFQCFDDELKLLEDNNQILFTYCDIKGNDINLNGSINKIAGISNKEKNIFGLMPHPERAIETILGSKDGLKMLQNMID